MEYPQTISIPLVIFGSTLVVQLMERFPIIVMPGAALIGRVGGWLQQRGRTGTPAI